MKRNPLFELMKTYADPNIIPLIHFAQNLRRYPIELVITKHLIMSGIDTEEKLIELLKKVDMDQVMAVKLQNYMRDITLTKCENIGDIPYIPRVDNPLMKP